MEHPDRARRAGPYDGAPLFGSRSGGVPGPGATVQAVSLREPWASAEPAFRQALRGLYGLPGHPRPTRPACGGGEEEWIDPDDLLFGRAVALVYLHACWRYEEAVRAAPAAVAAELDLGDFSPGRFVWATRGLRVFPPFEVRGKQGLFRVDLSPDFAPVERWSR